MSSQVQKVEIDIQCVRCRRRIRWAWLITYRSFRYVRLVYVCSECGSVIKVSNDGRGAESRDVDGHYSFTCATSRLHEVRRDVHSGVGVHALVDLKDLDGGTTPEVAPGDRYGFRPDESSKLFS